MNLYVEQIEVQENQPLVLYPTAGLSEFTSSGNKTRGSININDTAGFFVSDDAFLEMPLTPGAPTNRGNVNNDGLPVSMAFYGSQLLIASAGVTYFYDLNAATLTVIADLVGVDVAKVDYCDGYFIALVRNTNTFRISGLLDCTTWDPLDTAVVTVFSGLLVSLKVDHREIWVWSKFAATVYYNNGDADFPFAVNPSAGVIEGGIAAINSVVKLDNTLFWIGKDDRGRGVVWKANGYTPTRVSTHAVEFAISQYGDISDAVAYGFQDQGHSFYQIFFPTAEVLPHVTNTATWDFDVATGLWHERGFWDHRLAQYEAHHSWNHVFIFNKHLVGDWQSGKIYDMSIAYYDDDGDLIRRARRAPHISGEQKWAFHSEIQIFVQPGLGPQPPLLDGDGNARGPILNMRYSDDGGKTWSSERSADCGQAGEYAKRVRFLRLGRARDRIYEINMSDPVPWRIVDAFLEAEPGIS